MKGDPTGFGQDKSACADMPHGKTLMPESKGGIMGLWSLLFGEVRPSKEDLIRSLVKKRFSNDPVASRMGFDARMFDSFEAEQLLSTPEGSIVTIVETYTLMKKQGAPDQQIFECIEAHRSTIASGVMPSPLDLESYTQYRVAVEWRRHRRATAMSSDFISEAVQICRQHFGCGNGKIDSGSHFSVLR